MSCSDYNKPVRKPIQSRSYKGMREGIVAEHNNTVQSWTGYYGVKDTGTAAAADQQEVIDSVFSRLEKMQKRITGEKIGALERQLASLDSDLTVFLDAERR